MLSGCQNYVLSHELQITTQASKPRCFKSVTFLVKLKKRLVKLTGYPNLNKLCVREVSSFFSLLLIPFTDFYVHFNFLPLNFRESSCLFSLENFVREIGAEIEAARNDPFAHARCLTAVLYDRALNCNSSRNEQEINKTEGNFNIFIDYYSTFKITFILDVCYLFKTILLSLKERTSLIEV